MKHFCFDGNLIRAILNSLNGHAQDDSHVRVPPPYIPPSVGDWVQYYDNNYDSWLEVTIINTSKRQMVTHAYLYISMGELS